MLRQVSVVDFENSRLGDRHEPIVFAFKEVDVDLGDESKTPAELVSLYDSARSLQTGYRTQEARSVFLRLEDLALAAGNPVLALMARFQLTLSRENIHEKCKSLEALLARFPACFKTLLANTGHAMRLTCSLENFEEIVRSNLLSYLALEQGRFAFARLDVIDEMIAEGCPDRAEYFAGATAQELAKKLGEDHWWRAILLLKQGECLMLMGKRKNARLILKVADSLFAEWCCSEEHPLSSYVHQFVSLSRRSCCAS
ncbi:MAG: hypothetical protein K2X27_27225 [Candidatus Obscuribacterales bacterium]|nr:hypothetical protein [Candidatus Obscuribacterales bacterium]